MKSLLNYVRLGVFFELLCSIVVSGCVGLYFKFDYTSMFFLLLLDLFFINITKVDPLSFTYFSPIINKFIKFCIGIFFRAALLFFFVYTVKIIQNIDTCTYDVVLRWLLAFISIFFLFSSAYSFVLTGDKSYLKFYMRSLEMLIVVLLAVFFVFGFFKLFFAKYILLGAFSLVFFFFFLVRLLMINYNKSGSKKDK